MNVGIQKLTYSVYTQTIIKYLGIPFGDFMGI